MNEMQIEYLKSEFNNIVECICDPNELRFITYVKENLNIINLISKFTGPEDIIKLFNDFKKNNTVDFSEFANENFTKENFDDWHNQIHKTFIVNLIKATADDSSISSDKKITKLQNWKNELNNFVFTVTTDNQEPIEIKGIKRFIDSKVDDLNTMKLNLSEEKYYWKYNEEKLNQLYELLLSKYLIEKNENFNKSFAEYKVPKEIRTIWKGKQRSLFILLYLIYDKSPTYNSENISNISLKLFKLKEQDPKSNTFSSNFSKLITRVQKDKNYIPKNHSFILDIIKTLSLESFRQ